MDNKPFHLQVIREVLSTRQRANPAYSLRAYGRDLDLEPSTLSQVLKGRRPLPVKDCEGVAERLRLAPLQRAKFIESALKKTMLLDRIKIPSEDERHLIDESHFRVIAEWEHYAALTLMDLHDFCFNAKNVAERLNLSLLRAETVIQNLLNASLIKQASVDSVSEYEKSQVSVRTTEDVTSQALRASHLETLELGKKKLETTPVLERDFASMNFAFDPSQMIELKAMAREFRQKILTFAKTGKAKTEVFQLALQLYPLTQKNKSETQI